MATKMPRLNVVLEEPVYFALVSIAKRDRMSLSSKARDLIREALEFSEDTYWAKQATMRERTLRRGKLVSHKKVWGK